MKGKYGNGPFDAKTKYKINNEVDYVFCFKLMFDWSEVTKELCILDASGDAEANLLIGDGSVGAKQGNVEAMLRYARSLQAKDPAKSKEVQNTAIFILKKGIEAGDLKMMKIFCTNIGLGSKDYLDKDFMDYWQQEQIKCFLKIVEAGDPDFKKSWAIDCVHTSPKIFQDWNKRWEYLNALISEGDPDAMFAMTKFYRSGVNCSNLSLEERVRMFWYWFDKLSQTLGCPEIGIEFTYGDEEPWNTRPVADSSVNKKYFHSLKASKHYTNKKIKP